MATVYTVDFIICPWCNKRSGREISHLYQDHLPRSWGPWHCNECKMSFNGTVNAPGDVTVKRELKSDKPARCMVLLKFPGKDGPVFFIMDHTFYGKKDADAEESRLLAYYFEEHSCPTNWINECVKIIEDGNDDPHGFLEFVRAVDVPVDFDTDVDENWPVLFPEAFPGQTIDGTIVPSPRLIEG